MPIEKKEQPEQPIEGEIREIDGEKYRWTNTGYTLRQYFSHSTPEKGPGPGWDTRLPTLEKYGVKDPKDLPDEPYFRWELVEED